MSIKAKHLDYIWDVKDCTKSNLLTLLGLVIILACSWSLFEGIRAHVDLVLADDSGYLAYSKTFPNKFRQGYGPGYVLLFKVMRFIYDDPIDIHYNVIIFCSVFTSLGLFLMLRLLKLSVVLSLTLAIFLLYSNLNMTFDWWSRISHYSVFFLFVLVGVLSRLKNTTSVLALGTFAAFLLSYVRPETYVTFLVLAISTIIYIIFKGRKTLSKSNAVVYGIGFLFILVVLFKIGSPMEGGSRLMLAFAQHYTLNLTHWNNWPLTECLYWQEFFVSTFGEINSLGDLWSNGKAEIIHHLKTNFGGYFDQTFKHLTWMILPEHVFGLRPSFVALVSLTLFVIYVYWVGLQDYLEQVISRTRDLLPVLFVLFLFYAPTFASSVIIYPREHYLVLQLAFFYLILYILVHPRKPMSKIGNALNNSMILIIVGCILIIVGCILYFLSPNITNYKTKDVWGSYSGIKIVHGIHAVRDLKIEQKPVNLLTSTGPMPAYLSDNYTWVVPFNKTEGFNKLMDSLAVNMIYVDNILMIDRRYNEDPEFNAFMSNYNNLGWIRKEVDALPNKEHYILLKKELL